MITIITSTTNSRWPIASASAYVIMVIKLLVNISSADSSLFYATEPLPESMLLYYLNRRKT